jgi:hypothetical protein
MKIAVCSLVLAGLFAGGLSADAATNKRGTAPGTRSALVETPSELPELAQVNGEAIYLHDTTDGRFLLYIESMGGKKLAILDVTDPARVHAIAQVTIPATGAFDFVQDVNDSLVLIQYRERSGGNALLDLSKAVHPRIMQLPSKTEDAVLLGDARPIMTAATDRVLQPARETRDYEVMDTGNPSAPSLLATVHGVKQILSNDDTGTMFFLSSEGVTIVRQPAVEQEYDDEQLMMRGN